MRADGSTEELPLTKNMIVGYYNDFEFKDDTLQLDHGDTLVMFTDGVTEAMDLSRNEFGEKRLNDILINHAGKGSREIVDAIKAGITDFAEGAEQSDDITILVLRRK